MKEFRKNQDGHFICEECGRIFELARNFSRHINKKHNGIIDYYNKWIKEKDDGECKICGGYTEFRNLIYGYENCCSRKCINIYSHERSVEELQNKFGVENNFQRKEIKHKSKNTWLKNYKVDNPAKSKKIYDKIRKTNLKKYGVEHHLSAKDIQDKIEKTNLKKYGVARPMQNRESCDLQQSVAFRYNIFKNTTLHYRGSYELDFLEKFYDKIDIENGPSVDYLYEGKKHMYHADFYIPSLNLVVEIKNSYLLNRDKNKIQSKESATISKGYNYCLIVNKDYSEFLKKYKIYK